MDKEQLQLLPEEIRGNELFTNVKDFGDLGTQFVNVQSRLGSSIRIPGPDASDEDRTAFHTKLREKVPTLMDAPNLEDPTSVKAVLKVLGTPENADGYTLPEIEGVEMPEARSKLFRDAALEAGLTVNQLKTILEPVLTADQESGTAATDAYNNSIAQLKGKWGSMYDIRLQNIKKLANVLEAPESLQTALTSNKLGGEMIEFLHNTFLKFSNEGGELSLLPQDDATPLVDTAEAAARADEIRNKLSATDAPPEGSPAYKNLLDKLLHFEKLAHPASSMDANELRGGVRIT